MAFKLDLTKALNWPSRLSRVIDVDGTFRAWTLLAAMRVIAPQKKGDGFARHFADSSYPPDFSEVSERNVDAYRALAALFYWDGGESTVEDPTNENVATLTPVKAGSQVFVDVKERGESPCWGGYDLEKAAKRGEVHSCLASQYPYRYWWQAFNRAVEKLTEEFPNYSTTFEYSSWEDPYDLQVLPYSFKQTIGGARALTPDDLVTGWMASESARNLRRISGDTPWLITAEDIDYTGVFLSGSEDQRHNTLRNLWERFAVDAGFGSFVDTDAYFERQLFKDRLESLWLAETSPKYGADRLAQLKGDWSGRGDEWRDEFPYHGLAAMLGYLAYFESQKIGFALTSQKLDEIRYDTEITKIDKRWTRSAYYEIPVSDIYEPWEDGEEVEVDIASMSWGEVEKNESKTTFYDKPRAQAVRRRGSVGSSADVIGDGESIVVTIPRLYNDEDGASSYLDRTGHPSVLEAYFDSYGDAQALENALNEKAAEAIASASRETTSGKIRVYAESSAETEVWDPLAIDGSGLDGYGYWSYEETDFPFVAKGYAAASLLDENRYFFVRTTGSSLIAKFGDFNVAAKCWEEVGDEGVRDIAPILPDVLNANGKIKVSLKRAEKHFEVVTDPSRTIRIQNGGVGYNGEVRILPLPIIYRCQSQGKRVEVFPCAVNGSLDLTVSPTWASDILVYEPAEIPNESELFFKRESELEFLRSITFVEYDRNVIYPNKL